MKIILEIWLLFKRRILETLREPVWVLSGLMTPLLYIALFAPLLKNIGAIPLNTAQILDSFVPGILTLIAFGSGMGAGWVIIGDLQSGVIERLRVSPASRFSILMGTILRDIVTFVVPSILVILISWFLGFEVHILGLLVLIILLCCLTAIISAWSDSLGLILKQIGSLAAVVTGLQLPVTLLSGVLLPISLGPNWLQFIAHINPLYYTVEASRKLAAGMIANSETLIAFCVIIPLMVLTLWWATRVYKKAIA